MGISRKDNGEVVVKEFGQCGGMLSGQRYRLYEGPTKCLDGCQCVQQDEWLSICEPLNLHDDKCVNGTWNNGSQDDDEYNGAIDAHSLGLAAERGQTKRVKYLVSHGADVEARDESGWTSLMKAAKNGHLSTTKYLIRKGAKT